MNNHFGNLFLLSYRGFKQFKSSSLVASLSIAIAGGLFLSTLKVKEGAENSFTHSSGGFNAVLGARGSSLQLVLNSIFHLEASPGNLDWEEYELIKSTRGVSEAYPIAVGDNYMGYRLVGTLPDLFLKHEWKTGNNYKIEKGRIFSDSAKEALVGKFVASKLGLKIGDKFHPYHGLTYRESSKHDDIYVVVGILEATGTPADKVIWVPIKGIQHMEGHAQEYLNSVSAVLLNLKGIREPMDLYSKYNRRSNEATLVWPINKTIADFFKRLTWFEKILQWVAYMIGLMSGMLVLAILQNSINERKREFAILRCLGASRSFLVQVVMSQSIIISMLGGLGSLIIYFTTSSLSSYYIREETGVLLEPFHIDLTYVFVFLSIILLGLTSAILPSFSVYRVDINKNLQHAS